MPVIDPEYRNAERLNRAINHAHAHLHRPLQLEELAEAACLSKYHFARQFHDHVGESPVGFLKRLRLERAASLLRSDSTLSIKEIGYACGFGSSQLFSRSVRDWMGLAPSEIRTDHRAGQGGQDTGRFSGPIRMVRLAPVRVAYVRSFGHYGDCPHIDRAFALMKDWASAEKVWPKDSRIIGISWDYPGVTPVGKCRFDACVPLPADYERNAGMSWQVIPGGLYATAHVSFRAFEEISEIWKGFFHQLHSDARFRTFQTRLKIGPWFEDIRTSPDSPGGELVLHAPLDLSGER